MKSTPKFAIALVVCIMSTTSAMTQSSYSGYFIDGYLYRYTINPAIANKKSYIALPALGNHNISLKGNLALTDVLYQINNQTVTFLHPDLSTNEVLKNIEDNNQLGLNVKMQLLSAGFKAFNGYNTIGFSARGNAYISVPGELFRMAKEGVTNKTYDISALNSHLDAFFELSLGHTHQISEKFHVGATLKVLIGGGNLDAQFNKAELVLDEDEWIITLDAQVESSMKGFKYETDINENTNNSYVSGANLDDIGFINGRGFAVDLGMLYQPNDNISLSASVVDLGFIQWNNNVVATTHGEKVFKSGDYIFNVDENQENNFDDEIQRIGNELTALFELNNTGDQGVISKGIGTTINLGSSYTLPSYKKLTFGLLSTTRLQKNFNWTDVRFSLNWTPCNSFSGSLASGYGSLGASLGGIVNVQLKGFNLFVGMDQIIGKISKQYIPLSGDGTVHVGLNILF